MKAKRKKKVARRAAKRKDVAAPVELPTCSNCHFDIVDSSPRTCVHCGMDGLCETCLYFINHECQGGAQ